MSTAATLLLLLSLTAAAVSGQGCRAPQSHDGQVFCVEDDSKKGMLLGSVVSQKRMRGLFGTQMEEATFDFLAGDESVQSYFSLDAVRGHLRLARAVDRDRLCEEAQVCCLGALRCRLQLKVVVNVPGHAESPHVQTVKVFVVDKNDHAPRFPQPRTELTVAENARRGHELALPLAIDPDCLEYSVKDYFVPNGRLPEEFVLEKRRSAVEPGGSRYRRISRLMLRLDRSLDRERRANYSFPLVAVDGGPPPFSGTTTVLVRVLDHNDNGPRFQRAAYDAVVDEGRFPALPLLTVKAEDPDAGSNAETRYEFAPGTDATIRSLFDVKPDTGEILLKQKLDYEQATRHKFSVIAVDKAGHADTGTTVVTVRVQDRNDERPTISVGYIAGSKKSGAKQGKKVARIKENGRSRQFVAILTVQDRDRGHNGRVNCSLVNHRSDFLLEREMDRRSDAQLYMVYTGRELDREREDRFDLHVRCQDGGRPVPQTAELVLPVEVIDENDNKPTLRLLGTHSGSTVRVKENMAKGTKVIRVLAQDNDVGANSDLTYSMALSDQRTQALFRIDSKTGQITTRQSIDREAGDSPLDSLPVIVTVRDHGKPAHTSTLSLTIEIVDINDNAPHFVDNPMYFTLKENLPANYRVGEIRLVDKDEVDQINVRLDYARNGATLPFRVYREKGKFFLNTTASLDRERRAEYKFFIVAEDVTSSGSYRTSGRVHVSVLDVNDNTPKVIFPRIDNTTIHLSYREQKGFEMVTINVLDNDDSKDDGGKCFFELTPESSDILEIGPRSGTLRVRRALQEADLGTHHVGVVIRDNGQPPRSSFVRFTLVVDRSTPHRRHRDLPALPPARPGLQWRSDTTLIVVLVLIILLLLGIVLLIVYVRHWRHGFLFLPDLLSPCHRSGASQKRRRGPHDSMKEPPGNKYVHDAASLGRACDLKMRPGEVKEVPKASSDTCSFSGLYSGTPTRQHPGVTTPFLPRDNSKYESLDPQRQAFLQQQQRAHLQLGTGTRGRSSLPDSKAPDLTKRDYDSLLRGPDHYHVYQTISPGEALVDEADLPPGATLGKRYAGTLRRQSSAQARPVRYNSDGDLTAGPMEEHVGPRNASVKFVFPPKAEQVYTKTYPVMQTSFV